MADARRIETVVVGGGQSGLVVGYELQRRGRELVILDANRRTGDSWRNRWDSLRLFTPAMFNGLPGLRFPAEGKTFVGKDEMADYLEVYAQHFALPIERGVRVLSVTRTGTRFAVETSHGAYLADNVVVAMANYQKPRIPDFARELDPAVLQIHASEYRNPEQLRHGDVLVVGVGNSGADIALELSASRKTYLSGRPTGHVPFRIEGFFGRNLGIRLVRLLGHHILNGKTRPGRKVRRAMLEQAGPLVRVKPQDLTDAGVQWVERITEVRDGHPVTADGQQLEVPNVVWCTGYRTGFSWLQIPEIGTGKYPAHDRGVARDVPGLYFVGLHFQHAATSATITGMPRDARYVVARLIARSKELTCASQEQSDSARAA